MPGTPWTRRAGRRCTTPDGRFVELLGRRGGKVVAAAELASSREGWWLRSEGGALLRTEGPSAESVEQLGGFFVVEVPEEADLLEACGQMAAAHDRLEVRPVPD